MPDIDRFVNMRDSEPPAELRQYGGRPIVLFAARLIPKKRPQLLLRAFHQTCDRHDAVLAIVGDAPLRGDLEQTARDLGIKDRVHFAGFVDPADMPRWYANARVFVLPSSETWGVAVIESLASGTPVIVSDEVGCHPDVVTDGHLGQVVAVGRHTAWNAALARSLKTSSERPSGDEIRRRFAYQNVVNHLVPAIQEPTPLLPTQQITLRQFSERS